MLQLGTDPVVKSLVSSLGSRLQDSGVFSGLGQLFQWHVQRSVQRSSLPHSSKVFLAYD